MQEAWIQLQCPDCNEEWEASVNDLPAPAEQYHCDKCDSTRSMSEFAKTKRGLEVLREMHGSE